MATIKDNAVCVRLMDWSETSQIAVLMTERHGKVSATAKGAKRRQPSTLAKFSGGVELLCAGEAVLILKHSAGLANLIEWDLTDAHWRLRRDLRAYRLAMYAADLVHHVVQDRDPHPSTYRALRGFLGEVGSAKPPPGSGGNRNRAAGEGPRTAGGGMQAALLRFQWAVVDDAGYRPVLDRDAETERELDESADTVAFSPAAGGLVADTGAGDRWRVRRGTAQVLRMAAEGRALDGAPERSLERANRLLCAYFRVILDKELPTMEAVL